MARTRFESMGGKLPMNTYSIRAPLSSHWRKATCAEAGCLKHLNGWKIRVDGLPAEMLHAATHSGRSYHRETVSQNETWLIFDAGQPCFRSDMHRVKIGRPEIYQVRNWRGSARTGQTSAFRSAHDWVDSFAENQDRIVRILGRA